MSLIYGRVILEGKTVSQENTDKVKKQISKYRLDSIRSMAFEQGEFWCGIQYVTPESLVELLPRYDRRNQLALTADVILDNRKELLDIFNIPRAIWDKTTDSELILLSYHKWKEQCPKYLIGDYAFVIWDKEKKEIFGARDHVGKRTFYYFYSKDVFTFCTSIKPILESGVCNRALNDNWIADYLSLSSLVHEIDCTKTIYKNIEQLLPGHSFKITRNEMCITKYWTPENTPLLKLKSDEEYVEAFREVFFEAVSCRLRSNGHIGVMLSGGLDSSSVAVVAAKMLEGINKPLKAYSFIPYSKYKDWLPKHLIANEKEYIEEVVHNYSNIDITYCDYDNLNAISNIPQLLDMFEQPYKIVTNLFWADQITEDAHKFGCRVLLDGQYGNITISAGDMYSYLLGMCRKGRFIKYLEGISDFSKLHHVDNKKVLKHYTKCILPDSIKKLYYKFHKRDEPDYEQEESFSFVNPQYAAAYHADQRLKQFGFELNKKRNLDLYDLKKQMNNTFFLSQAGCIETKLSLQHGVVKRDPTRDKRVIEFCMSLPINQYVNKGQERSLVRRSLSGILPDKVRLNYAIRGKQSADFVQRLKPDWPVIKNELEAMIKENKIKQYVDSEKITQSLNVIGNHPKDQDFLTIQMLINCLVFCRYIVNERR